MESRKLFLSLHNNSEIVSLRREMISFQRLMDTLKNYARTEVEYIKDI